MRILQVNSYADPVGGAENYMLALGSELERRGHSVGLFGTSPDRDVVGERIRVPRRPRYDRAALIQDPGTTAALSSFVERFDPDLIHAHNLFSLGQDLVRTLGSFGIPLVQTFHDYGVVCPNSWCVRGDGTPCTGGAGAQCFRHRCQQNYPFDPEHVFLTLLRQNQLASSIDVALCPSQHLAKLLARHGFPDVRPLPYFVERTAEPSRATARAPAELLFLGRLEPEKGLAHLLDALPRILEVEPRTRLTLVGDGSAAAALHAKVRELGLDARVDFHGKVEHERVREFHARATALVLPSIWSENSPLAIYEALAIGLPVLGSRVGGIPELIEDGQTGFLFEPRDPADLAEKALKLLGLPPAERERMALRMRERARELSPEQHLDRLEEIYDEILARPARRAQPASLRLDERLEEILARLFGKEAPHERHIRDLVGQIGELKAYVGKLESDNRQLASHTARKGRRSGLLQLVRTFARHLGLPKVFA